jgi:transposase
MDTQDQALQVRVPKTKQRRRTIQERREIVEETLLAGASVSRVARRHDVNANQLFYWRKLYREGPLGTNPGTQLLAVKVTEDRHAEAVKGDSLAGRWGTMEVELPKGTLRMAGAVDVVTLRAVLECLAR